MAGILDSGISGLLAYKRSLETTSHNISNVNTEGYSRQRVNLETRSPQLLGSHFLGSGVDIRSVERVFDQYLQNQLQSVTSSHGTQQILFDFASQVDDFFGDARTGLTPVLGSFFDSLQDINDDPTSVPARQVMITNAESVIARFNDFYTRLDDLNEGINAELQSMVDTVNSISKDIAAVNKSILVNQNGGTSQPNDLLDRRDHLLTELSQYVSVNTLEQDDGTINVFIGNGQSLVVGTQTQNLAVINNEFDPNIKEIAFVSGSAQANVTNLLSGGSIGGLISFRGSVLDKSLNELGMVAVSMVEAFNTQHRMGQDLDGNRGTDFFSIGAVEVLDSISNTGAGAITVARVDSNSMELSDYQVEYNGGNAYTLTRLSDNTTTTINTGGVSPFVTEEVDGMSFTITAGAAVGDRFLVRPTRRGSESVTGLISDGRKIAVAAPMRTAATFANIGDGAISAGTVNSPDNRVTISFNNPPTTYNVIDNTTGATLAAGLTYTSGNNISFNGWTVQITDGGSAPAFGDTFTIDALVTTPGTGNTGTATIGTAAVNATGADPDVADPVTITFNNPPNTFTVTGSTTGSPTVNVPYTAGQPISFNGWTVEITGAPVAGDSFTVGPNTGGVTDNRNGLILSGLESSKILANGKSSLIDAYGAMIADVGATTSRAEVALEAQSILLREANDSWQEVSGVNLDEEAANLVKFQQAYQAAAQVISAADSLFQTLINAVSR